MSTSTGMVAYQSTLQTYVPAETRGRAFAFYDELWNAARLLSLAAGGVFVDIIDVRIVYVISAALLLTAAAIGLTTNLAYSEEVTTGRSEEHTSELQSLFLTSYAVFRLHKQ